MKSTSPIEVRPIYGWGWSIFGHSGAECPDPFEVVVAEQRDAELQGQIGSISPVFPRAVVILTPRHKVWDGFVNVRVSAPDGTEIAVGYARVKPDLEAFADWAT